MSGEEGEDPSARSEDPPSAGGPSTNKAARRRFLKSGLGVGAAAALGLTSAAAIGSTVLSRPAEASPHHPVNNPSDETRLNVIQSTDNITVPLQLRRKAGSTADLFNVTHENSSPKFLSVTGRGAATLRADSGEVTPLSILAASSQSADLLTILDGAGNKILRVDGSGGVRLSRTLPEVFNVKGYGAQGDGVTDDHDAIQTALDAASAGGGTIYFPGPAAYLIQSPLMVRYERTNMVGERGARLRAGASFPANRGMVEMDGAGTPNHFVLSGLDIDGNSAIANNPGIAGIQYDGINGTPRSLRRPIVTNCNIHDMTGDGIRIVGSPHNTIKQALVLGCHVDGFDVTGEKVNNGAGIYVTGCDHPYIIGTQVQDFRDGILVEAAAGCKVLGCHVNYSGSPSYPGTGIRIRANSGLRTNEASIISCDVSNSYNSGVTVEARGTGVVEYLSIVQLAGRSNGRKLPLDPNPDQAGLEFMGDGRFKNCTVSNCRLTDDSEFNMDPKQDFGLKLGASGTYVNVVFAHNNLNENRKGPCLDASPPGAGIKFYQNEGYNPRGHLAPDLVAGPSPFTYTNGDKAPEDVYLVDGTVTEVRYGDAAGPVLPSLGPLHLEPEESIRILHTSPPTIRRIGW